eukprot:c14433_g1_i1 orf=109-282(-)
MILTPWNLNSNLSSNHYPFLPKLFASQMPHPEALYSGSLDKVSSQKEGMLIEHTALF